MNNLTEETNVRNKCIFDFRVLDESDSFILNGFHEKESIGRHTSDEIATIKVKFNIPDSQHLLLTFCLAALAGYKDIPEQNVDVYINEEFFERWTFSSSDLRIICIVAARPQTDILYVELHIHPLAQSSALGINADNRFLGILVHSLEISPLYNIPNPESPIYQVGRRNVGTESARSWDRKLLSGFWAEYIRGNRVLDIGFKGYSTGALPIVDGAIGVDLDFPGYDGRILPFADESQDTVYASHCLEHISDYINAFQEWYRVVRVGGTIIIAVPSAFLYERKRRPPSRWNIDHKRFYTPSSLLAEIEAALVPNSYRVRYLMEEDADYNYNIPKDKHPYGQYEITLVVEKIDPPTWKLDD